MVVYIFTHPVFGLGKVVTTRTARTKEMARLDAQAAKAGRIKSGWRVSRRTVTR